MIVVSKKSRWIHLVRHAKAGDRSGWSGPDHLRPLTEAGQRQARALIDQFANAHFGRIVSSPYVRCLETVVPISAAHMLPIEPHEALAEGAPIADTLHLLAECSVAGAVWCSHGDIIPNLLGHLAATTKLLLDPDLRCAKGSTWSLEIDARGHVTTATYRAPPTA